MLYCLKKKLKKYLLKNMFKNDWGTSVLVPSNLFLTLVSRKRRHGVNFTNILFKTSTHADPKSAKRYLQFDSIFMLLGTSQVKTACKTLVKLIHDVNFTQFHQENCAQLYQYPQLEVTFTFMLYASVSQPVCRDPLVCRDISSAVPPNLTIP